MNNLGWICPKCNRGVIPSLQFCNCDANVSVYGTDDVPVEIRILEDHSAGLSGHKIASRYDLTAAEVYALLKDHGVVLRRGRRRNTGKSAATASKPREAKIEKIRQVIQEKKPGSITELKTHFKDISYGALNSFMFRNMKKEHRALSRKPTRSELRKTQRVIEGYLKNGVPVDTIKKIIDTNNITFGKLLSKARSNVARKAQTSV